MIVYSCFPKGKCKALTMSYDDGVLADERLVEIFNKHGIKGTFNLNYGRYDHPGVGRPRIPKEKVKALYEVHEVATHGYSHPTFTRCPIIEVANEIMEYLWEKLFRKIGVSEEAYCLKCPGGHSWGDSAILCRAMDFFLTARFTLNGGSWNGEQLLNERFVKAATSKQVDNILLGSVPVKSFGYGYQFWITYNIII